MRLRNICIFESTLFNFKLPTLQCVLSAGKYTIRYRYNTYCVNRRRLTVAVMGHFKHFNTVTDKSIVSEVMPKGKWQGNINCDV